MIYLFTFFSEVSVESLELVLREVSDECTLALCKTSVNTVELVCELAEILSLYIESVRSSVIVEEVLSSCESLLNLIVSSDSSTVSRDLLVALLELIPPVNSFDELSSAVELTFFVCIEESVESV